jgi:hypothetical protein
VLDSSANGDRVLAKSDRTVSVCLLGRASKYSALRRSKAAGLVPCIPQEEQRIPYGQFVIGEKWQDASVCLAAQGLTHTCLPRSERLSACLLVRPAPTINNLKPDNALAGLPARSHGWAFYPLGRPPLHSRKADLLCAIFRSLSGHYVICFLCECECMCGA